MTADAAAGALPRRHALWAAVLIVACGILAYANSLGGVFVLDDEAAIAENASIRRLWPLTPVLFSATAPSVTGRPVLNLSLAINYAFGGTSVTGYHVVNVLIHLLAGLALFGVIRRTLLLPRLRDRYGQSATTLALAATLLWTVHPLQTESVTYVIQRGEALVGLLYLLTLYCAIRAATAVRPIGWNIAAVVCCFLGMATKEVMVSAPLVVLMYDWIFLSGSVKQALRQRWGLYTGLAASWVMLVGLMASSGQRAGTAGFGLGMGMWEYARTQFGFIVHYLQLCVWPDPLVLDYGIRTSRTPTEIIPAALIVALLIAVTIWALLRRPMLGFLGFCFFAILSPTSSIVPLAGQVAAEHRMYLPLACVTLLVVLAAYRAGSRWTKSDVARSLGWASLTLIVLGMGYRTIRRNADYHNTLAIWQNDAAAQPDNARVHNALAKSLSEADRLEDSVKASSRAIELEPRYASAYYNRGAALERLGRLEAAMEDYNRAIQLDPKDAAALTSRAGLLFQSGNRDAALREYDLAIAANPALAPAYYNRGVLYQQAGRVPEALSDYTRAINLKPDYLQAYNNRALLYQATGNLRAAVEDLSRIIQLNPGYAIAYSNRAACYLGLREFPAAVNDATRAIALNPGLANAHSHRAIASFYLKQYPQAWADVRRAQELGGRVDPNFIRELTAQSGQGQ